MAVIKLGDVCVIISGMTSLSKNYKENGSYYFLDYKSVFNRKIINDDNYYELQKIKIHDKNI